MLGEYGLDCCDDGSEQNQCLWRPLLPPTKCNPHQPLTIFSFSINLGQIFWIGLSKTQHYEKLAIAPVKRLEFLSVSILHSCCTFPDLLGNSVVTTCPSREDGEGGDS